MRTTSSVPNLGGVASRTDITRRSYAREMRKARRSGPFVSSGDPIRLSAASSASLRPVRSDARPLAVFAQRVPGGNPHSREATTAGDACAQSAGHTLSDQSAHLVTPKSEQKLSGLFAAQLEEPRLGPFHIPGRAGRKVHRYIFDQAPSGEGSLDVVVARTARQWSSASRFPAHQQQRRTRDSGRSRLATLLLSLLVRQLVVEAAEVEKQLKP